VRPGSRTQGRRALARGQLHQRVLARDDGLGESAGLAPQLALALGRGVDVIAQNDSGAFRYASGVVSRARVGRRPTARQAGRDLGIRSA